jgi:hypothetical protein
MSSCVARQGKGGGEDAGVNEEQIAARLATINTVYPGTNICCVMAPTGTVLCVSHIAPAPTKGAAARCTEAGGAEAACGAAWLRAQHTADGIKFDEVQAVIAALKLAAINFGETAGGLDCHVIHIKGNSHIFSCYDIGRSGNVRMPGSACCPDGLHVALPCARARTLPASTG